MSRTPVPWVFAAAALLVACDPQPPASSTPDGSAISADASSTTTQDAGEASADAAAQSGDASALPPDASAGKARTTLEIVSGAGRLTGGSLTLDVQLGHPVKQQRATNGARSLEGGAAVKP